MANIFISHSSMNKDVARTLAKDLQLLGHQVWLDEWTIKVGQCIPTEIEKGIGDANFIVLLLSEHAVLSNWVSREWKAAYWDEVNSDSVVVLPIRLEECAIPKLLQTKKYADFSKSYAVGFRELADAIDWYSNQRGLVTAYESSYGELPHIIRGSNELTIVTCAGLTAKAERLIGCCIVIKNAHVLTVYGSTGQFTSFKLFDKTGGYKAYVRQDTELEDVILGKPQGNFFGKIESTPGNGSFIVSEWES